jgi:hypothetical protein
MNAKFAVACTNTALPLRCTGGSIEMADFHTRARDGHNGGPHV